ncbi:MAG: helix-turn-helix domain-containing protein [Pseudonocardiaceae bacterium]
MPGDATLGAVLRELRTARGLTLAAVARQAGCAESLVSYVESGQRQVHPWLAEKLDRIYRTGSAVKSLARGSSKPSEGQAPEVSRSDVFVVQVPHSGATLPLSRREVMASLGVGIASGGLLAEFERALEAVDLDSDVLQSFEDAYHIFWDIAGMLPLARLLDGMMGDVAVLDVLRRRAVGADWRRCGGLQARYADLLSWMSQEAGDEAGALWWNDRAVQWAQGAGWLAFTARSFVRRTAMVHSFSDDGLRMVDHSRAVLEMSHASPRMKGVAAGDTAYGYALAGIRDESRRALDSATSWLSRPARADDDTVPREVTASNEELASLYQTTCDIYLGYGARAIPVLETLPKSFAGASFRTATATRAKLARAYANAGQPDEACRVAWEALDATEQLGSQLARTELRRALPVLNRWHGRSDVRDVVHRLQNWQEHRTLSRIRRGGRQR